MIEYKYKFPIHENNTDLFGKQNKYNVFIDALGYTYLGTYEEFMNKHPESYQNDICMKIPMGYKAIVIYERLNIIENGNIIWSNSDNNAINRNIDNNIEKPYVFIGTNKNYGWYYAMNSYDEALNKVTQLSMESKEKFLICKALRWVQWH